MIKLLFTVAILGSLAGFTSLAVAQSKQGEAFGRDVSSQCAHRRVMPPDPRDGCVHKLRNDAQLGYGQSGAAAGSSNDSPAAGTGPGNGGGPGNGIGPGNGGGQGKGRR